MKEKTRANRKKASIEEMRTFLKHLIENDKITLGELEEIESFLLSKQSSKLKKLLALLFQRNIEQVLDTMSSKFEYNIGQYKCILNVRNLLELLPTELEDLRTSRIDKIAEEAE